jgi:outer membrane biosynthesis protein TonB
MKNIRSAFGFLAITALMCLVIVGAVMLTKSRNEQYANQASAPTVSEHPKTEEPAPQQPQAAPQTENPQPVAPQQPQQAAPVQIAATPQPETPKVESKPAPEAPKTTPAAVPSTGPTEVFVIALLAMGMTYWAVSLIRMKSLFKRI